MKEENRLTAVNIGIDTRQEPVVYMRSDCHICRAEGFDASSRLRIASTQNEIIATLNIVDESVLPADSIGLSKIAWRKLNLRPKSTVKVSHVPVVSSLQSVRKKIHGHQLSEEEILQIIEDIAAHRYSDIEIASFLSACAGNRMDNDEIISLTRAMVSCGQRIYWDDHERVFDKHCIGGLPGNRTTPLVVSICSTAGLLMPKTSSRAITSPAGTADTMEVLTNVDLSLSQMKSVVRQTNACLAWGGAMNLSPADDLLIRIERALDLDGEGQLVASVLSKKIAAGSTHVLIDIPVGSTAKVRRENVAKRLSQRFTAVGKALGLEVLCVITDGESPVGSGIGPVQEAHDILAVLNNEKDAPADLRERSLVLAAHLLTMAELGPFEKAHAWATETLNSGQALKQFERILDAQGGLKSIPKAQYEHLLEAQTTGSISAIDNRRLARLAKLAGAPLDPVAGLRLHINVGSKVVHEQPLATLYADSRGELDYALGYYNENMDLFTISEN
jgi:thymidine phosphorylase